MEERLNKFLSRSGVCSRRKADEYIECGRVSVNGKVVHELGIKVKDTDVIEIDGNMVSEIEEKVYIKLNKPVGFVSTAKEQFGRPCVTDLSIWLRRIWRYSAGKNSGQWQILHQI